MCLFLQSRQYLPGILYLSCTWVNVLPQVEEFLVNLQDESEFESSRNVLSFQIFIVLEKALELLEIPFFFSTLRTVDRPGGCAGTESRRDELSLLNDSHML